MIGFTLSGLLLGNLVQDVGSARDGTSGDGRDWPTVVSSFPTNLSYQPITLSVLLREGQRMAFRPRCSDIRLVAAAAAALRNLHPRHLRFRPLRV